MMIRSFLLLSSCIAAAFSAGTFEFKETPGVVYGRIGGGAVMVWEYDLGESELLALSFEHFDTDGKFSVIMNIDANGIVSSGAGFPHASFTQPATLTLKPLQDSDAGDVKCTIYRTDGTSVSNSVSVTIFPDNDQKDVIITLKVSDKKVECGLQTIIDSDETIVVEVPVESDSGAPIEVNAFQKCGEGQENQIGPECTKGSGNCTFETSAGCHGFTEGLVTIRATVKHPAFDEAKEDTCSYTVQDMEISLYYKYDWMLACLSIVKKMVISCSLAEALTVLHELYNKRLFDMKFIL
ncbi:hypothetical protein CAPTEDRAFT_223309 [Capitella teleta]|uniref:CUB domain-containing protein n=1 Tax=Capitella teleta TaxID=283909 RepID=R7T6J1_CAPTE|nr:hypothetical protein CAPTEDRAFT_223309 [Capitella teleta]|eukprot:ELT89110.1 hypothetical protein CAPTEDRAFT_223309 [Capitella teleta]